MFKTFSLPKHIEDAIKVLVSFKVLIFIIVGAIESSLIIKESFLMDQCIDTIKEKIEKINTENEGLNLAKAVHFCEGGHVIDQNLVK